MSTQTKIAEVYNITGSLELNNKLIINLWSNLREHYCKVLISCLGSKNVFTSSEESLIILGDDNLFYRIETSFSKNTTPETQHWNDWRVQPIEVITNNSTMNYLKYNIPVPVYLAFIGVISGCAY
jgi:hypothetical protein